MDLYSYNLHLCSGRGAFTPPTTNSVGDLRSPEEFGGRWSMFCMQCEEEIGCWNLFFPKI